MSLFEDPTPRRQATPGSVWRGRVTRVAGEAVFVEIKDLVRGFEWKCEDFSSRTVDGQTQAGGDPSHVHGIIGTQATTYPLQTHDAVLVIFVASDDPVIIGRRV